MQGYKYLTYQMTGDNVIVHSDGFGSILIAEERCLTYTLNYDEVIGRLLNYKSILQHAQKEIMRMPRNVLNEGFLLQEMSKGVRISLNGAYAEYANGLLRHTRKFKVPELISIIEVFCARVPRDCPTFEGDYYSTRYIKEGNLFIVGSGRDCLVFNAQCLKLEEHRITNCLFNDTVQRDVKFYVENEVLRFCAASIMLIELPIDLSLRTYFKLEKKGVT